MVLPYAAYQHRCKWQRTRATNFKRKTSKICDTCTNASGLPTRRHWGKKMSDDIRDIAAYYDSDPAREHSRLEEHQLEYELTWRYLDRYLPSQGSILEVGAASGRYTLELAKRGYTITAVDLSAALLEECR